MIKYAETSEWEAIREQGVVAAVYDETLWGDKDAMVALMLGDNLNAAVQVGEDELQAFGRVDTIVAQLARSQPSNHSQEQARKQPKEPVEVTIKNVYDIIEREGFGKFDSKTFVDFIKPRLSLNHKAAQIFKTCQQHSVGFRVQVKSDDYKLVSQLDSRC